MTTNESLARSIEGQMIDWRLAKRRARINGNRPADLEALVAIADGMMPELTEMTITWGHIQTELAGAHGMFSRRVVDGWHAAQRGRTAAPVDDRIPA